MIDPNKIKLFLPNCLVLILNPSVDRLLHRMERRDFLLEGSGTVRLGMASSPVAHFLVHLSGTLSKVELT